MENKHQAELISPQELSRMMEERSDLAILDILTGDHYQRVHLPGAQHACVFEVTFLDQVVSLIPDQATPIVIYGASAGSAEAGCAAEKLTRQGYDNLRILQEGLQGWRNAGLPLEGDGADQPEAPEARVHLKDRTCPVDTDLSLIHWTGRNPHSTHFGTLQLSRGELRIADKMLSGEFEIDMSSIQNINLEGDELQPILVNHLKSDDFFFTDRFPKASFQFEQATPAAEAFTSFPNYDIEGILDLCGIKADLRFPATLNETAEEKLVAEAHFDFDRTRWGIIYGSSRFFEHLGMHLVFDLVSIQIRIVSQ